MAFEDIFKGGNIVTGLAVGAGLILAAPLVTPVLRPLAKTFIKGGILAYRGAAELYASTMNGIGDIAAEAGHEVDQSYKKAGAKPTDRTGSAAS